jgi:uncharacterized membrane protein YhaH (DUF805 family)
MSIDRAGESANFLFRSDQGEIDARQWWRGTALLGAILAALTMIMALLSPYMQHDLSKTPLFSALTFAAFAYLLFYTFAIVFIAISYYNLSAKRWRDRARPAALAGLLPLSALFSAAIHWLHPRAGGAIAPWQVLTIDLLLIAIIVANVFELGCLPHRNQPESSK